MSDALCTAIRRLVAEDLARPDIAGLGGDDRREFARRQVFAHLDELTGPPGDGWSAGGGGAVEDEQRLAQDVLDALFGLGRLQSLIDDCDIENIDINGCDRVWVTYADGTKELAQPIADSDEELIDLVKSAASRFGLSERRFDMARPELDLRLPDGSRLSALMAVSVRPAISIRRHRYTELSLDELVDLGTVDASLASFLSVAVRARKNIVVAGAMNSGKTTLLRALAAEIPARERLVTIEQAFELGLDGDRERHPDIVALEARPANLEGEGLVSVADLVRRALRMNADRVIVGEVLGDEILPMLNAMSQGRSGSMCTIHADSSAGAFRRIASYAVQAPERLPLEATNLLIAGAIHFVVFLDVDLADENEDIRLIDDPAAGCSSPGDRGDRIDAETCSLRPGGPVGYSSFPSATRRHRFVASVREVVDAEGPHVISNEIYAPGPNRRAVLASPLRPDTAEELARVGHVSPGHLVGGLPA
jgi:pilus assembly protein CpaF